MSKILLTGSRAYGPVTEDSDIDIVMEKTDALRLLETLKSEGVDFTQNESYGDTSSFKFSIADELPPINIIVAEDEADWFKWEHATSKMKEIGPIDNREERIAAFHIFQIEGFDLFMQNESKMFFKERMKRLAAGASNCFKMPENDLPIVNGGFIDVEDDLMPPIAPVVERDGRKFTAYLAKDATIDGDKRGTFLGIMAADGSFPDAPLIAAAVTKAFAERDVERNSSIEVDDDIPF